MGNAAVAAIFEAAVPASVERPTADSSDKAVEAWIRNKYERKLYLASAAVAAANPTPAAAPAREGQANAAMQQVVKRSGLMARASLGHAR